MKVNRGYKTELDLTDQQRQACVRHAGAARYAYNYGLARKIEAYRSGQKVPTAIDLHRELNELKKGELAWMYEVSKCAPQEALRDLDNAYKNFFRGLGEKKAGRKVQIGRPRFKSRKKGIGSFRLTGVIHVHEKHIQLPRLGKLRLKEKGYIPTEGVHILSAAVSERAGRWFVSVQVEMDIPDPQPVEKETAGVDLGVLQMATVSDGKCFANPRALKREMKRVKRQQRRVSRREKGSANWQKAVRKLARAHYRVANIRKDALHKATSWLARTKSAIMLEDLNVSGMLKNHHLAQAIADVGFHEFRRQMAYKGKWYGCEIRLADRFYPSSKRCSGCGRVKPDLGLGEREYRCGSCGLVMDRDLNAAINLERLLYIENERPTASSAGRGEPGLPKPVERAEVRIIRQRSLKQEPSLSLS